MNGDDEPLLERARSAAHNAHVPYSGFRVGAAVLGAGGEVVAGCNVESSSFGLTCCAERVALFAAIAAGVQPVRLAVSCLDAAAAEAPGSRTPCGACRQVALDLMGRDAIIDIDGLGSFTTLQLLPHAFAL